MGVSLPVANPIRTAWPRLSPHDPSGRGTDPAPPSREPLAQETTLGEARLASFPLVTGCTRMEPGPQNRAQLSEGLDGTLWVRSDCLVGVLGSALSSVVAVDALPGVGPMWGWAGPLTPDQPYLPKARLGDWRQGWGTQCRQVCGRGLPMVWAPELGMEQLLLEASPRLP